MRVRADDRDRAERSGIEWQDVAVVLEERDRLAGCLQRELAISLRPDHAFGMVGIDERVIEQAEPELPDERRSDEVVELALLEHAFANEVHELDVAVRLGGLDVDAGANGEHAAFALVVRDEVAVRVGPVAELPDRVVVGDGEAVEAPFVAQHVAQEPAVRV